MKKCRHCVTGLFWACDSDYCYQERQGLVEEAQFQTEQHGHVLTSFAKEKGRPIWRAECLGCGQEAIIRLDPAPNEPDVYGEALVTDCPERAQVPN
jgi:hypothetical protein